MHDETSTPSTRQVSLKRLINASSKQVFRALTSADALAKWHPPNGFVGHVERIDAQQGGGFEMVMTQFRTNKAGRVTAYYDRFVPQHLIEATYRFDDPDLPHPTQITIELQRGPHGTRLTLTQRDVPEPFELDSILLGWQESVELLARIVEPDVSGLG